MSHRDFLLIIDEAPISNELTHYFAQFNIDIKQQKNIMPVHLELGIPLAIIINWKLVHNQPQIIHQFYNNYPVPLLIISDFAQEEICISVLAQGADDFMVSPIYPRELHARINAIRRRVGRAEQQGTPSKEVVTFANWKLLPASRQVFDQHNQELHLSAGEYDLLLLFVQQSQRILDRELLLQITKNSDLSPLDRRIDVQISRLRQKIELDPRKPKLIKTIRNGGYMFTPEVISIKE